MNLGNYTVPELKQEARDLGLSGYSNVPKGGLINLIGRFFSRKPSSTPAPRPASPPLPATSGRTVRIPLTIPKRMAPPTPNMIALSEDVLYELAQYLNYNALKNLCTSNREYRRICQTERFQQLIEQSRLKTVQAKVQQVLDLIEKSGNDVTLVLTDEKDHNLEIWGFSSNQANISERSNEDYFSAIIYKYFKEKLNFKGFENLTPDEYYDFLTKTKFEFGKIPDYALKRFLKDPIYAPFNLLFSVCNSSGKSVPIYEYQTPQLKPGSTLITLGYVKPQEMLDILTLAFKNYPDAVIKSGRF